MSSRLGSSGAQLGRIVLGSLGEEALGFTANAVIKATITKVEYATWVKAYGPSAYYRLNDRVGTTAIAEVGPNGTYSGTYTLDQPGALVYGDDRSVYFNDGRVTVGNAAAVDLGASFSIVAWFRRTTTGTEDRIVYKSNSAYSLTIRSNDTVVLDQPFVGGAIVSTITITDTNWHFVVATWGSTSDERKLYIDNIDRTGTVTNRSFANNTSAFVIAEDSDFGNGHFTGDLDEVALYQRPLTSVEIERLWHAGSNATAEIKLDAFIVEAITTVTASFTADAYSVIRVVSSYTANAIVFKTTTVALAFNAELVARLRHQHNRADHEGTDSSTDHVLALSIGQIRRGVALHDVIEELDRRITGMESGAAVAPRVFWTFSAAAVIKTTTTGSLTASAVITP